MRRKTKSKITLKPDLVYSSTNVAKLINYIMYSGKKEAARKAVYSALKGAEEKLKVPGNEVLETVLKNVGPIMEVRSKRVGGANYQVPVEVRPERRLALALRWIIDAARSKKGMSMDKRLMGELLAAYNNEGEAIKKRENVHKMAEANRAFAHFGGSRRSS